jgi:hypothetical protein
VKVLKNVPENIGKGEGGGSLPALYDIFKQIDEALANASGGDPDLKQQVDQLKSKVDGNTSDISDLDSRVKALEDASGGDGGE